MFKKILFFKGAQIQSSIRSIIINTSIMGSLLSSKKQGQISIAQLAKGIKQLDSKMSVAQKIRACCFVLGATGSGKSTLISYCCGAELKHKKKNGRFIMEHNDDKMFPKIGNTHQSCTTIPSVYTSPEGVAFYDPPGFMDSRGNHQQIINSYSNTKMFKLGSRAKIIIVMEVSTLQSARGEGLVKVAQRLRELFANDFLSAIQSCFLLVTKVNSKVMTPQEVIGTIEQILNQKQSVKEDVKTLLRALINHKRIDCFPVPQTPLNCRETLIRQFMNLPQFSITREVKICLSAQAKIEAGQLVTHLEKDLQALFKKIGNELSVSFRKNLQNKSYISDSLVNLKSAKQMILNGELESPIPSKLDEFQRKLLIKKEHIEELKQLKDQLIFCLTINPYTNVPRATGQILLHHISQVERGLDAELSKISTKQQNQQLSRQYAQKLQNQKAEFMSEITKINQQNRLLQQKQREQALNNNQRLLNQMAQENQKHMTQIQKLNYKIERSNKMRISESFNNRLQISKLKDTIGTQRKNIQSIENKYTGQISKLQQLKYTTDQQRMQSKAQMQRLTQQNVMIRQELAKFKQQKQSKPSYSSSSIFPLNKSSPQRSGRCQLI